MANMINGASPSVNITVSDFTFLNGNPQPNQTTLGIVGETLKGKAFTPMFIDTYSTFKQCFGALDPCTFPDNCQLKYEAPYIAKQYLKESGSLFMTRVLGLSGYDAGDAWGISYGSNIDLSTITISPMDSFSIEVKYINGVISDVFFNRPELQTLYENGVFSAESLGTSLLTTGDTISSPNVFYGNCDGTFSGANYSAFVVNVEEKSICITGTTTASTTTNVTTQEQSCIVNYGAGTITQGSSFIVAVVNTIVLIGLPSNRLITVDSGFLQIDGGTITHNNDGSINIDSAVMYLPSGDIISGGSYKLCSLEGNDAYYDCNTINGVGYTLTSGMTTIVVPTISTNTSLIETEIPTGIITITYNGVWSSLSGLSTSSTDETLVVTLRSKASYDGNESLNFEVVGNTLSITPTTGSKINPYDSFTISGLYTNGKSFTYSASLDRTKKNYIGRIFGSGSIQCCDNPAPFYIEENYIVMFERLVAAGLVDCIKPTLCYNGNIGNYKTQYTHAITPWVLSELRGNKVFRLFRFNTISDGNAANEDVKISFENIRPDRRTFDIVVRSYYDTDSNPIVLERYTSVNLSKNSNSYIGLAIGTSDGNYPAKSKYITVEISGDCLDDSFPAGFEGYPVRDWNNCKSPTINYKTNYGTSQRTRNIYLGVSDSVGIEQDFFNFKGLQLGLDTIEWTGRTEGFYMDKNAANASVEGGSATTSFQVGLYSFQNELELIGTDYEPLFNRKFTFAPFGGFDGWDIHRGSRTNTDQFTTRGNKGVLGTSVGNFKNVAVDDIIGITSDYYAYLKGILAFNNPEEVQLDLIATGGINAIDNSNLVESTIEMIENDRCDAFYIFNMLDADLCANQVYTPAQMSALVEDLFDSPYAASYVHWGLYNDTENNVRVFLPPTAEAVRIFAKTDRIDAPWYAGAGLRRALTEFSNVRAKLRQSERDLLYTARLNSIYSDNGNFYLWGNRTMQIADTPLKQISLVRLVLYLRKIIHPLSLRLLFEPNDANVRSEFRRIVEPVLRDVRDRRGISAYRINISNNPDDIDRGILNGSIQIKATPALEEINLNFSLTPTGASFEVN